LDAAAILTKAVVIRTPVFQKSHPRNILKLGATGVASTAAKAIGGKKPCSGNQFIKAWDFLNQIMTTTRTEPCTTTITCFEINNLCNILVETPLHGVQSGAHPHLQVLMDSMNMGITCLALAGRLPSFLENWQLLTQERDACTSNRGNSWATNQRGVQPGPGSFISQLFLVEKKDGDSDQW